MKIISLTRKPRNHLWVLIFFTTTSAYAEPVFQIDPQVYGMHKKFGPPSPITPQTVLSAPVENQFDRADRNYTSVARDVDGRMDKPWHFTLGQYSNSTYSGMLFRKREADYYLLANAAYIDANDYRDGGGNKVNYGYTRDSEAVVFGMLPNSISEHRFTFVHDNIKDDKQPQTSMDAVKTERMIGKYNLRLGQSDGGNTIYAELAAIDLDRRANNFDLRSSPQNVRMQVDRERYTADIHYRYRFNNQHQSSIGFRYEDDTHNANRYTITPVGEALTGRRFADVNTESTRIYASHEWTPNDKQSVKGAISYDWQSADVKDANQPLGVANMPSPSQQWQMYYGKAYDGEIRQNGLSGKARYTYGLSDNQVWYGQVESLYRMPDNIERFAVMPGPTGSAWAANPWVRPERENRLTLGTEFSGGAWRGYQSTSDDDFSNAWHIDTSIYYAYVHDFIILDRYRGSNTALTGNIISDNVNANLAGVGFKLEKNWNQNFSTRLRMAYTYGDNQTDNRPLYQIAPFESNINLDWKDYFSSGSYNLGAQIRYVNKQTRMDSDMSSGLGADNPIGSFATLDLYGAVQWRDNMAISFGVDNVFDREYAEFISGDHVEAVSPAVVNAPGRFFWVRFNATF